jgi:uncharacterized protein
MIKTTLTGAALALALVAHSPSQAQAGGKKELVAKVLQLQQPGIEAMARQMAEQPAMQLMQQAGQALQRLPAERREAVAKDVEADLRKYADEAVPIVRDRANQVAASTIGPILEERFTEDELRQVIAMLESPTIRKFQGMAGEMQKALVEKVVADTRAEIEPKARAMTASVSKRLTPPTPPASGAAPKK